MICFTRMIRYLAASPALALALAAAAPGLAAPRPDRPSGAQRPVRVIANQSLTIGAAQFPLFVSRDWSVPLPNIRRAVLILHGYERNADGYFRVGILARDAAGAATIVIAPQFLDETDAAAHALSPTVLRWRSDNWEGGDASDSPIQISSYAVLDLIIQRLSDRRLFPALTEIVVAGHSGGGQVAQRYAILAHGDASPARPESNSDISSPTPAAMPGSVRTAQSRRLPPPVPNMIAGNMV